MKKRVLANILSEKKHLKAILQSKRAKFIILSIAEFYRMAVGLNISPRKKISRLIGTFL